MDALDVGDNFYTVEVTVPDAPFTDEIVVICVIFGAAWILAELAFPLVFILGYAIILRAVGRVARDRHACQGNALRSIGWGAAWSTIYMLPFAIVIVCVHIATQKLGR